jgi:uncharacterized membrane protein YwzB
VRPRRLGALLRGPSTSPLAAMKTAALFFASLGIVSAVVFIAGAYWYGRTAPPGMLVGPTLAGVLLIATHYWTLRRIRLASLARSRRWPLLVANFVLLGFFVLGLLYFLDLGSGIFFLAAFALFYLVPLAVNAIYLLGFDKSADDLAAN